MAKVFTIPVPPKIGRKRRERTSDPRYVDGQRLLVEAMKYLAQSDPVANRGAIELLSEHVRTRFRISDSPLGRVITPDFGPQTSDFRTSDLGPLDIGLRLPDFRASPSYIQGWE